MYELRTDDDIARPAALQAAGNTYPQLRHHVPVPPALSATRNNVSPSIAGESRALVWWAEMLGIDSLLKRYSLHLVDRQVDHSSQDGRTAALHLERKRRYSHSMRQVPLPTLTTISNPSFVGRNIHLHLPIHPSVQHHHSRTVHSVTSTRTRCTPVPRAVPRKGHALCHELGMAPESV